MMLDPRGFFLSLMCAAAAAWAAGGLANIAVYAVAQMRRELIP